MAKRFTDTDKWKKPFIRSLEGPYKLLWFYILDDCNHAGIWEVDMEVASIRIGHQVNEKEALQKLGGRAKKISNSKWFIPDFIFFQYGELNEKNRLHLSVINILNKNQIMHLLSPLEGVKDKDMDKDKEQYKDKEHGRPLEIINTTLKNADRKTEFLTNQKWKEEFCMAKGIQLPALEKLQREFISDTDLRGEYVDSYKRYFTNWYNKTQVNGNKNGSVKQGHSHRPTITGAATEAGAI